MNSTSSEDLRDHRVPRDGINAAGIACLPGVYALETAESASSSLEAAGAIRYFLARPFE